MAKKSYQERVREQREQEILRMAARLVHEQGYNNLNMDVLADEVGISKSTLYQHFRSKEEMMVRVLIKAFNLLDEHMQQAQGTPLERMASTLRYLLRFGYAPDGFATTMMGGEVMALFQNHSEVGMRVGRTYARLIEWIEDARASGEIRAELTAPVISSTMFGMLSVLNSQGVLRDEVSLDDKIEQAVSIWIRGIAA